VWWIGANLLREREAACDESVLEEGHHKAVYAESILHVCRLSVAATSAGIAASTGGNLVQRMSSIMKAERASPLDHGRFALLLVAAMIAGYGPIAVGIVGGALREASAAGPIDFAAVTLKSPEPHWWGGTQFDADTGTLALSNVSLRDLISLAYPASRLNADPEFVDRVRYDIEARWPAQGESSERNVYRELLKKVLQTHSNLQLHVTS
jgi:hypothetical protein